jgi:hypothetical protein
MAAAAGEGLPPVLRVAGALTPHDERPDAGPLVVQCVELGDVDEGPSAVDAVGVGPAGLGQVLFEACLEVRPGDHGFFP